MIAVAELLLLLIVCGVILAAGWCCRRLLFHSDVRDGLDVGWTRGVQRPNRRDWGED